MKKCCHFANSRSMQELNSSASYDYEAVHIMDLHHEGLLPKFKASKYHKKFNKSSIVRASVK